MNIAASGEGNNFSGNLGTINAGTYGPVESYDVSISDNPNGIYRTSDANMYADDNGASGDDANDLMVFLGGGTNVQLQYLSFLGEFGEEGDDTMYGEEGDDFMDGGNNDDTMHGGEGDDIVFGDDGDLSKKKRIQKEDILRVIAELGDSLNQTAKSISDSTAEINTNLIKSFSIQNDLVNQIKVNGTSLEDRLDDIVKALTNQTQVQDKAVRDAKKTKTEDDLEEQSISSDVSSYDDLTTPEDETKEDRPRNMADDTASMRAYGFEKGGIVTGPKTGYPVTLHGTEAIIPLDNYATDNISGNEMTPGGNIKMAERGSGIKFTKVGRSTSSSRTSTGVSNISQDILDAQEIAVRSTGARLLSDSTQYLNTIGGGDPQTAANIQRMQAVVANKYDLPRSSVSISKNQQKSMSSFDLGKTGSGNKQKSKGFLESITDGISDFFKSFGGNNNPPATTDPNDDRNNNPRSFKDIAGSLDQFSEQELSDLGRIIYAETGSDKLRAANVMNTILNRYRQIKSGTVSPGEWGINGKTKEEVTLSDIIKASDQYSPIADGSFDKVTSDQGKEALNNAIAGGGLNPQEIYENLVKAGVDERTADTVARADSFSNPDTRSVKPFPVPETGALKGIDPHSYQAAVDKTPNKFRQAFKQKQPQTKVNKNALATSSCTSISVSGAAAAAAFACAPAPIATASPPSIFWSSVTRTDRVPWETAAGVTFTFPLMTSVPDLELIIIFAGGSLLSTSKFSNKDTKATFCAGSAGACAARSGCRRPPGCRCS